MTSRIYADPADQMELDEAYQYCEQYGCLVCTNEDDTQAHGPCKLKRQKRRGWCTAFNLDIKKADILEGL